VSKIAVTSDEPCVHLLVPIRLVPQLVALLAAAANAGSKPCVETTVADEPIGPGVARALPSNVHQLPARKVG
jgi:hypothetical protein